MLNNDDIQRVLTAEMTINALENSYRQLIEQEAVCRPRIDIRIPTRTPGRFYQWGTMEGGSTAGYFAIRMKSDVLEEQVYNGARTEEKFCLRPGLFCGLIFLTSVENGEPLALINDGYLQHLRVAADGAIGAKIMSRKNSEVLGMLGSGGMARSHVESLLRVRDIKRIQVFSPTKANREKYAVDMHEEQGIEVVVMDNPRDVYRGADILAGCTDSAVPVIEGLEGAPGSDQLKHFGAAMASFGSTALFHLVGLTPEASRLSDVAPAGLPQHRVGRAEFEALEKSYRREGDIDVVVFSAPQLSLLELRDVAGLCDGRHLKVHL